MKTRSGKVYSMDNQYSGNMMGNYGAGNKMVNQKNKVTPIFAANAPVNN